VDAYLTIEKSEDLITVSLKDNWLFGNVPFLQNALDEIDPGEHEKITFRCGGLQDFDLAGAWVLYQKSLEMEDLGLKSDFIGFKAAHFKFLHRIIDVAAENEYDPDLFGTGRRNPLKEGLEFVGQATLKGFQNFGFIARAIFDGLKRPSLLVVGETMRQINETGVRAIPIVMVISFLMGVVMAYQSADQLEKFGVTIFVVDLVSNTILREIGVLLAAIMVAGRSGSAFAAALGTMKLNEEIDALRVMGLNPNQVLILPRVLGLVIAMPFLTIFANLAGLLGGLFICIVVLDISIVQFLERLVLSADMKDVSIGLIKAPFFALLIAGTGTLRGMQVKGSAEELGRLTTVAVVQSIFLIIIADAFFTVLFSRLGF
jgi:phospholipid/cholesterol/gamma-HCH transport system permease protein